MKWGRGRQRHYRVREVQADTYAGPQGAELLGAHVTDVIQEVMREAASLGGLVVLESFRVVITEDYGDYAIEVFVNTIGAKS